MKYDAHQFFIKHGYVHTWGDSGCFDMSQLLVNFPGFAHSVGDTIDGIEYRWATEGDLPLIAPCIADAAPDFVPHYRELKNPTIIAVKDGEVVGALMVFIEADGHGVGSVGCTVTKKAHQGKGIATSMVQIGTKHLKQEGFKTAFLGYTYTDIVKMYARAGYTVCMEYFMGEKQF
jgi:ribosomal protein S18 acetylase RimI-like enzyme